MALRSDDKLIVVKTTGANKQEEVPLSELNTFISSEEAADITTLETSVGTYLGTPSTISLDVSGLKTTVGDSVAGLVADVTALQSAKNKAVDGAVVAAVAAKQTLTLTGNVTEADTVVIGTTTYRFMDDLVPDVAYDVLKGATASDTLDNLIAAINKAAGEGSKYGTGTVAHPIVKATAGDGDTMLVTAKVNGTAYNTTPTTNPIDSGSKIGWGDTTLKNGIDGTVGGKGTLRFEATKLWTAITDCTVSDSTGWKYITFTG